MIPFLDRLPRQTLIVLMFLLALLLVWRVVARGGEAVLGGLQTRDPERLLSPLEARAPDLPWRVRLAQNPTDAAALVVLALELERTGQLPAARDAMREAVRLAPGDDQTLVSAAGFYLRAGDEAQALAILRRAVDLYPGVQDEAWPVFATVLAGGARGEFFVAAAREDPKWWPAFFDYLCQNVEDVNALQGAFAARLEANTVTAKERRCMIGRLQRENRWTAAYQAWLNSLPVEQRRRVGYVFNGDFELPLTNIGFDWLTPILDGVAVETVVFKGLGGRRALRVEFVNKRWTGPPVLQYLMLFPGQYRLEGRGRSDGLETWLGLQWGIYCLPPPDQDFLQLGHSERFLAESDWENFSVTFAVPADCAVQVLRLELANPRRDADTAGNVPVRMRGSVWFDDLRVRSVD